MTTKICIDCGGEKLETEFPFHNAATKARRKICKKCHSIRVLKSAQKTKITKPTGMRFDEILSQWVTRNTRKPKIHLDQARVKGAAVTAAAEQGEDYLIRHTPVVSLLVFPVFGHPTGVSYS